MVLGVLLAGGVCFVLGFVVARVSQGMNPYMAVLQEPLRVELPPGDATGGNRSAQFLPAGTVLTYEDEWIKKEGDLYRVYVRIFGEPLAVKRGSVNWLKVPLTAWNLPDDETSAK